MSRYFQYQGISNSTPRNSHTFQHKSEGYDQSTISGEAKDIFWNQSVKFCLVRQEESTILFILVNEIKPFRETTALARTMLVFYYPASSSIGREHGRAKPIRGEAATSPVFGKIAP